MLGRGGSQVRLRRRAETPGSVSTGKLRTETRHRRGLWPSGTDGVAQELLSRIKETNSVSYL